VKLPAADLAGEVRVGVQEARQQRHVTEIHVVHGLGHRRRVHRRDEPAFHDEHDVLEHLSRLHVEHTGGA